MPQNHQNTLLPPSRPLDVHRWSDYPELNSCLTGLIAEIERSEVRKRARSSGAATRLRNAVRCIILDLYVAWLSDPDYEVGISLGKDSFKQTSRYDALFLRYDSFHPAYRGLCALGYVLKVRPHFHDPRTGIGRVTRIRATPKLIQLLTGAGQLKRAFNKLVNTSGGTKPTKKYNAQEYGLSWSDLLKRIKARHKPIAQFLGTGEGVRLQAKDAQIANRIMQRFLDKGYVCLPVHDSFIVHHALKKELKIIMQDEFYKEAGAHIDAKPKFSVIDGSATEGHTVITQYATSDEPFGYADGYTGHESRLNDWWASQRTRPSGS